MRTQKCILTISLYFTFKNFVNLFRNIFVKCLLQNLPGDIRKRENSVLTFDFDKSILWLRSLGSTQFNTITKAVTKRSADHTILQRTVLAEKRDFANCKRHFRAGIPKRIIPSRQCPLCCVNVKELSDFESGSRKACKLSGTADYYSSQCPGRMLGRFFLPRRGTNKIDRKVESVCQIKTAT